MSTSIRLLVKFSDPYHISELLYEHINSELLNFTLYLNMDGYTNDTAVSVTWLARLQTATGLSVDKVVFVRRRRLTN